mmetsp:Transcript_33815/g.6118  ORF Transcript_33815/g.6118 Transcript_33815/m.6118 type:complete len:98 (-) Transcript_33815:661-954(-)
MALLAFSFLISATDPVAVLSIMKEMNVEDRLYNIILGESIFNDAVCIVLYSTVQRLSNFSELVVLEALGLFFGILIGSVFLGILIGILVSLLLKNTK